MAGERIHLHQAEGLVLLTEAHVSPNENRRGLEVITVIRWRDESGVEGQDTVARLVNYLKQKPGSVGIKVHGHIKPVDVAPDGRTLMTRGAVSDDDPLLELPTFDTLD